MDLSDPPFEALTHGRLDNAYVTPETGLVALTVWCPGGARRLGVGVGPRAVGIGWLPRSPSFHAGSKHPLIAALKAHALGRPVRSVALDDDGALWVTLGDEGAHARIRLFAGLSGEVRVLDAEGALVLAWQGDRIRAPFVCEPEGTLDEVGAELSRGSDALAAELRRGALLKGLRAQAKRLARRREAVEHDLERVDDVARLQRIGRMLLAQGSKIAKGASKATLEDWEEGGTLEIELDPALPAKPQAEGFFAKAKRIARGEAMMWARLEETQRAIESVKALEAEVDAAETVTLALLEGWMTAAQVLGVTPKESTPGAGRAQKPPRLPFIEYADVKGHRVLVGRGAKDNDELTMRVAKPHDLWLHARGVPGAHVVVPLAKGAQCPTELLVDAATLAAYHSDARGQDLVEVTWTERRYVRKPKGSPTGRVTLDRERVMALRVEPDRVARILAARRER